MMTSQQQSLCNSLVAVHRATPESDAPEPTAKRKPHHQRSMLLRHFGGSSLSEDGGGDMSDGDYAVGIDLGAPAGANINSDSAGGGEGGGGAGLASADGASVVSSGTHEEAAAAAAATTHRPPEGGAGGDDMVRRNAPQSAPSTPPRPVSSEGGNDHQHRRSNNNEQGGGGMHVSGGGLRHSAPGTGTLTRAGPRVVHPPTVGTQPLQYSDDGTADDMAAAAAGPTGSSSCPTGAAAAGAQPIAAQSSGDDGGSRLSEEPPPQQQLQQQQQQQQLQPPPQGRESVLRRLSETLVRGSLTVINLSQRGLTARDADIIKLALIHNPTLSVLKLGYNSLGDDGAATLASAVGRSDDGTMHHHPSLSVLDLGFNGIGDEGCMALATRAVSGNPTLETLYLSGNNVREAGAAALAAAIVRGGGCGGGGGGLTCLHLTANRIGTYGVRVITVAIAEAEARVRVAVDEAAAHVGAIGAAGQQCAMDVDGGSGAETKTGKSVRQLYLGGANMGSPGCLAVSNMTLTSRTLRVLSLSDNGITDRDLAFFSQSIARNRQVPLEVLQFSFNRITCVGVESLMNAIWGSETLRDVRLDNNRIHDRGAQLAAVVLTSTKLRLLDLGFNRITTVGIRALMKSLSENNTLESLTLSGNPLDTNASKAVSYALAYNKRLRELCVDNCSVGYAAQRHIAAGIVSNPELSLSVITGFRLGSIAVTLGLPPTLEQWTNEQTLRFIRLMWERRRCESKQKGGVTEGGDPSHNVDATTDDTTSVGSDRAETKRANEIKSGPADPATVVSAAKSAFAAMGGSGAGSLLNDTPPRERSDSCPLVPNDAIMLERTPSGNIRVPRAIDSASDTSKSDGEVEGASPNARMDRGTKSTYAPNEEQEIDPARRKRLEEWLSGHFGSLNELSRLPFNDADLWQLHQYFFSPVGTAVFRKTTDGPELTNISDSPTRPTAAANNSTRADDSSVKQLSPGLIRKISYRSLSDAAAADPSASNLSSSPTHTTGIGRRRSVSMMDGDEDSECPSSQPAPKRARSNKPRIDYYPRVRTKLEALRSKANQNQALIILRQLKYVEGVMFQGKGGMCGVGGVAIKHSTSDAEAILDML